ncbi:MAG: phosphoribosylformimino-5-aminoimidazole carboxamide ribotide isomerase [Dorea sp.]|jgi:phosphoribosylformimino-5-aminoimidazole carboxamide ribotide isomerase|nr:phosphoribosylformimino-5-aminoimidazole carboxamide ribotide isomerase [Dorea sp.]
MRFRPCIDIHNGTVKQIVGGSLTDKNNQAVENYQAEQDADYFARMYQKDGLKGGHVILLNPPSSEYYIKTKKQAMNALAAYPQGLQIGGGVTSYNAEEYLRSGASHVIVTSYVFQDGVIRWENMESLRRAVGKEHVVIDLSCRKKDGDYYIVTNRWQTFTEVKLTQTLLAEISEYCDEFLVHGVDVEGRAAGVDEELVKLLRGHKRNVITYAGGIGSLDDLKRFQILSEGRLDFTIGSALNLFGGEIPYEKVCRFR